MQLWGPSRPPQGKESEWKTGNALVSTSGRARRCSHASVACCGGDQSKAHCKEVRSDPKPLPGMGGFTQDWLIPREASLRIGWFPGRHLSGLGGSPGSRRSRRDWGLGAPPAQSQIAHSSGPVLSPQSQRRKKGRRIKRCS